MTVFESMHEFLKEQEGEPFEVKPRVQKITSIKLKEDDDDFGAAGKHYIVKCKMLIKNTAFSKPNTIIKGKVYDATCLVDAHVFNEYREKTNKVIWL